MMRNGTRLLMLAVTFALLAVSSVQAAEKMLAHDVYFTLKDKSPEAQQTFIAACKKYLSGHPGTVWFAAGARAAELKRDVNDVAFDVALHVVFKDKAAHDVYAKAERHLTFIEEHSSAWEKVRVFDSYLDASSHEEISAEPAAK